MGDGADWIRKRHALIFSLLILMAYVVLYLSRSLDDNRLTSWESAFAYADVARVFLLLIPGLVFAYVFSRVSLPERYHALFLFAVSYVTAAVFWSEPEVIVDASRYFTQAKHLELYGPGYFLREWGRGIAAWTDMPVVPFLYGLIFKCLGEGRLYIQIFTTALFSATVLLTYLTAKTLWDEYTGLFAGLFLLGIPYLYSQVPLMLVDVASMFFLMLSVYTFIRALEKGGITIAFSSLAMGIAFFTKYSTWLMLTVLPVIFLMYLKKDIRAVLKRGGLAMAAAGLLIAVAVYLKYDVISEQVRLLLSYQRPGLRRWGESFVSTFFFQIHPVVTVAALWSIYCAARKRDLKYLIVIWLPLLILGLQIRRIRYIIMVFPMVSTAASYGLMRIRDMRMRKFVALSIVISSIILAAFVYLPFMNGISPVNLKHAGEFLDSLAAGDVEVFTLPPPEEAEANPAVSVPVLDLFTSKKIIYRYDQGIYRPPEGFETSSLRFTWGYKNPEYYADSPEGGRGSAVAVIYNEPAADIPGDISARVKDLPNEKTFNISDEIFGHQTFVKIYYAK